MATSPFATMLLVTSVAGLATGLGAMPTLLGARVSHRAYDAALGLAAGIMVAASVFGLIVPGLELGSLWQVMAGVFLGGFGLLAGNRLIPHLHVEFSRWRGHGDGRLPRRLRVAGGRRRGGGRLRKPRQEGTGRPGPADRVRPRQTHVIGFPPSAGSTFTSLPTGFYVPGGLPQSE